MLKPGHGSCAAEVHLQQMLHCTSSQHWTVLVVGAERLELHPIQAGSADAALRGAHANRHEGTVTVPGRSLAVFVEPR